jgi:hypothetical protein
MQYAITISGRQTGTGAYTESVSASQLNIVLTIDKTLDYGSFVVRNQRPEPYEVGDMVDIDITDGVDTNSYHFIVSADDVTQLPNGYYIHAINIIELTKILEWQTDSSRSFTQPLTGNRLTLLDVVVRLQATLPLVPVSDVETTRVFALDNDLRSRLAAVEAPEFQFTNRNLKEMLFEVFDFIGAIPRLTMVSNNLVLTADFYNERGTLVTPDAFFRMKRLDIKEYSTALDSDIKNLYNEYTTVVEPAPGKYQKLTSTSGLITEDSAFIKTDYPIVEIESLKVLYDGNEYDITEQIVEKEEWDRLENLKVGQTLTADNKRDNTLFFTRYQKNISSLFDQAGITNQETRLSVVIRTVLQRASLPSRISVDYRDVQFQITYKAMLDTRVQSKRIDTINIKYDSKTYTGQTGNLVRADRALDRLFKLQQLLGNASIMTSERITALDELYELGDFKSDDYIITTIELICEKKHILTKYLWSQNYQKVSEFVDVNSEIRLTDIPARTFRRSLYIENFVEVDLEGRPNTSFVTPAGIQTFANTIAPIPSATHNTPIGLFSYNSDEIRSINKETETIIKPLTAYAGGNSINFHMEFDNPKVAGFQIDTTIRDFDEVREFDQVLDEVSEPSNVLTVIGDFISGLFTSAVEATQNAFQNIRAFRTPSQQTAIDYTTDGYVFNMDYQFVEKANFSNANSGLLPVILKSELVRPLITAPEHLIFKDARENLAITQSIHVLPVKGLENRIIIGKYLTERNNLLKSISTALNQFEVFTSDKPYSITENAFSRLTDTIASQTYSVVPYEEGGIVSGFVVSISQAIAKEVTWGIRKKNTRELVFVVNPGDVPLGVNSPPSNRALWFTFRNRQSFVQYPNQASAIVAAVKRPVNIQLIPPSNNPTDTTIDIVWTDGNPSPFADSFEVGISTNLRDWVTTTQAYATTNAKQFTGLTSLTLYFIRIRAVKNNIFSEYAYFEATTTAPAPSAPTNLQLTLLSDRRILATWDEFDGDVFLYRVEVSESSGFSPLISGGLLTTFAPDTSAVIDWIRADIDYDTQYFVRVRALRNGLFSAYSSSANITTIESPFTSAPLLTNISVSGSNVTFTMVNTDDQLVTFFADFSTATTSRATGVRPNEARTFTIAFTTQTTLFVRAKAALKENSAIVQNEFVPGEAPNTATILTGSDGLSAIPRFNILTFRYSTALVKVDGFFVERNPDLQGNNSFGLVTDLIPPVGRNFVGSGNDEYRFIDSRIESGQSYTYRVRAVNIRGTSTSTERSITSAVSVPAAPSGETIGPVIAGAAGEGFFVLSWTRNSTDELGFRVQRRVGAAAFADVGGTAKAQTSIDQTIVGSPNTTYDYRIIAYNENGDSPPSGTVSVLIT